MKSTKPTDEFEINTCLKGLGRFLSQVHSSLYEFCYYLTFKKALKAMAPEFNSPEENLIPDMDFFEDVDDPIVRHAHQAWCLVIDYYTSFLLRYGFDDLDLGQDEEANSEVDRYAPAYIRRTYRLTYKRETVNYKHYIEQLSHSFYYYACALSVGSYQIPVAMRVQVDYTRSGSFRLLNVENYEVSSLIELIENLQEQQFELEKLMKKKWW